MGSEKPRDDGERALATSAEQRALENPPGRQVAEKGTRSDEPDVLLHVPLVKVDEINLEVDNLRARVSLHAAVGNLVAIDVGADAMVERVKLEIKGVEAQALLKVRLEKVYSILERTLTTIDNNPQILQSLLQPLGETIGAVGRTVEKTVPELGGAVGRTVEKTVPELGGAVGRTVEKTVPELGGAVGRTVEKTVPELGGAVGHTVEQTVPELGGAVGHTVEKTVPELGGAVTQTVERTAPGLAGAVGQTDPHSVLPAAVGGSTPSAALASNSPEWPRRGPESEVSIGSSVAERVVAFDGTADSLARWRHVGGGAITCEAGELRLEAAAEPGLFYYTGSRVNDFRLRLQFRPEGECKMGVGLRFRDPTAPVPDRSDPERQYHYDNPAFAAMHTGFEVQLGSQRPAIEPGTFHGILIGDATGAQLHATRSEVALGAWNDLDLTVQGDDYTVRLNGKETARFTNVDSYRGRPAFKDPEAGFLGIVMRAGRMAVRRIEVAVQRPASDTQARAAAHETHGERRS